MGGITITTYLITTVIAVSVGLGIVNIIKPGNSISEETRIELLNAYEDDADKKREAAAETKSSGPLQPIIDIVPSNIINAEGLPVYAGLIDSHAHFYGLGFSNAQVDLKGTKSFDEIVKSEEEDFEIPAFLRKQKF